MIRVNYCREDWALEVRGHSGSADPGKDLICAGVTALVLTLRENLLELERQHQLSIRSLAAQPGEAAFRCKPRPGAEERLEQLFDAFMQGFLLLERLFGAYIRVQEG